MPILARMASDGVYRSQFETGTSNGGLTAYEGGDRWRWESRIFAGAYDGAPASERPTYGSLNHRRRPAGGSPRFGSAFFRLTADSLRRTTFCYPDSNWEPEHFAVVERMSLIGLADAEADENGPLDDYIEAHVHGGVRFDRDVEALVLDPCYRGSAVAEQAQDLPCRVEWHHGFRLSVDDLRRHPDFRGPDVVDCGVAIAEDGWLDPRIIGDAARAGRYDEQLLKRVWHYVARFGGPHDA